MKFEYQQFDEYVQELKEHGLKHAFLGTQYVKNGEITWSAVVQISAVDKSGDIHTYTEVETATIVNQGGFDEFKKTQEKKQDKLITQLQDASPGIKILMGRIA